MAPRAAAIYARISSDPDGTSLGVTRQVDDCRALAGRRRWAVAEVYVDNDISAYSGRHRPEYERMLEDVEARRRDGVIVYHLDRLHRRPRELEDFLDACSSAGVRDMACVTGEVDLATHDGQFHARILGAVSRKESDDKSRRLLRKHLEIAHAGRLSGGGTRPYGYAADRVSVIPGEAAVIREMARRVLAGDSLRSTATDLNRRGVLTVSGREWSAQVVRQLLISARISGQRELHGEIISKAVWPAVIRPQQTKRLRAKFNDPQRRSTRVARKYLLASLLRCHACGRALVARPRETGQRRYVCVKGPGHPGCGGTFVMADPVEKCVVDAALTHLDDPEMLASLAHHTREDAHAAAALSRMDADQARLDEIAGACGRGEITYRELLAIRSPIARRIDEASSVVARSTRTTALAGVLGQPEGVRPAYAGLPLSRQQAVIAAVLDHAVIGPAVRGRNRFDPDRVTPVWRV